MSHIYVEKHQFFVAFFIFTDNITFDLWLCDKLYKFFTQYNVVTDI